MKENVFTTGKSNARWVILFSLLIGLLFSSGEGISLFPFPFKSEGKQLIATEKSVQSYNLSAHSLSQQPLQNTAKLQKSFKFSAFQTVLVSGFNLTTVYPSLSTAQQFQTAAALALRRALLLPLAGRAPPSS